MAEAADEAGLVSVRLLEVPVALRFRSVEHGEGLVREMTLLTMRGDGESQIPRRLVDLAAEVTDTYGPSTAAQAAELESARANGLAVLPEVVYRVPPQTADFIRRIATTLDEVEEYCRAGEYLLTLASPPDLLAYRRWSMSEFERQIEGAPPMTWPEFCAAHGLTA